MARSSSEVQYIARLDAPSHIEQVTCHREAIYRGEMVCSLKRSGRTITTFVASSGQVRKIRGGKGKLDITQAMISRSR